MAGYELDQSAQHKNKPSAPDRMSGAAGLNPGVNAPIECECGSTFFFSVHAEQFAGGGYGSAEMRSISGNPVQLRICAGCGTPHVPQSQSFGGGRALGTRESFYQSMKKGETKRKSLSLDNIAKSTASLQELQDLQAQVAKLTAEVEAFKKTKEPKSKTKQPTT